jgi:hypothetical protein
MPDEFDPKTISRFYSSRDKEGNVFMASAEYEEPGCPPEEKWVSASDYDELFGEFERLKTAINRATGELQCFVGRHRDLCAKDGSGGARYALLALEECVAPEKEEDAHWNDDRRNPTQMTNRQLVDIFASLYRIHSNPAIYRNLKAGYDEILARLERGKNA